MKIEQEFVGDYKKRILFREDSRTVQWLRVIHNPGTLSHSEFVSKCVKPSRNVLVVVFLKVPIIVIATP